MRNIRNLFGFSQGKIEVVSPSPVLKKKGRTYWEIKCTCGNNKLMSLTTCLRSFSCGCTGNKTHGNSKSSMYNIWRAMKLRCYLKKSPTYRNYGARGITVCDRWRNSFENFARDMGEKPSAKHTLDRIDNDGNYEPENCRWATMKEQIRNRRVSKIFTLNGVSKCQSEWAELYGISKSVIQGRLKLGWSPEEAIRTPVKGIRGSH